MASIKKHKSKGKLRGMEICGGAERFSIWIGKPSASQANLLLSYISQLETSKKLGLPCDNPAVLSWLTKMEDKFYEKLVKAELVPERRQQNLSQLFEDVLAIRDLKPGTIENYTKQFERFTEFLEDKLVKDVTEADCLAFANSLTVAPDTKATTLRNIKHALAASSEIVENPFNRINTKRPAPDTSKRRLIDRATIRQWCDKCTDKEFAAVLALGGLQGCRVRSEPSVLEWQHISFEGCTINIPAAKTKSRITPLFADTTKYLKAWHKEQGQPKEGLLFPRLVTQHTLIERMKRLTGLKIPKVWINLRSSAESHLVSEGFPLHTVATWLGNSPIVAAKHYLQISPSSFEEAKKIGL
ncbi:site-specific integrase [bacterium]|nr:site-specific integrase [bacterium]